MLGISPRQLQRIFTKNSGDGIKHYYLSVRLRRARERVIQSSMSILDISIASGFYSVTNFSQSYKAFFGISPVQDRKSMQAKSG
ncbi:helix-turn-helix domain-containing protein [Paraburkholderia sp. Ac-20342]|nr:helix-turn-helix domain-containing protein [Paraburkholderia sp. Ac-20342]